MKKYFLISILIFAVVLLALAGNNRVSSKTVSAAAFNGDELPRGLCVTATSTVKLQPDFANVSFSVETKNMNLGDAQSENAKRVQDLMASLREQNIDESDIKTVNFYVFPEYDYSYGQRFTGYRVNNQINVKVKDFNNTGKLIDAATCSGAIVVSGIQFSVEDYSIGYNRALKEAFELAKEKAAVLSQAATADNLKIVSIKEIPSNFYGGYERVCFAKSSDSGAMVNTQIMQGEIEISATVEVRYELPVS